MVNFSGTIRTVFYGLSWLFAALSLALAAAVIQYFKERFRGVGIWIICWSCFTIIALPIAWATGTLKGLSGYRNPLAEILISGILAMAWLGGWVWNANSWAGFRCQPNRGSFYTARCNSNKANLAFNILTWMCLCMVAFCVLVGYYRENHHKDSHMVIQPPETATGNMGRMTRSSSSSMHNVAHTAGKEVPAQQQQYPAGN
ncbi:hypothetical protein H4219_006368 [Mycoemilia scoparia]|uniref:MARVEL domain-containing protein n=1 Tax=Mycoemilia scoparia TaxID=417184 RepID=A0A9W7ZNV6_9FUNG|nr:hypothetical protein H4219_006368 [Mycoemilia scoparia]